MLGFLARRGYDADMARKVVDQVWQELADEVEGN
jgi:SOS response regulatory protein OraA/RecX